MDLYRQVLSAMGNRPEVEFQELLPKDSTCRTACRAFSHVLGETSLLYHYRELYVMC